MTLMMYEPEMPTQTRSDEVLPGWFVQRFSHPESMLELMFQPIIDIRDRSIVGAEALLRWSDTSGGFVNNGQWIPDAEQAQLMPFVDQWVLRAVLFAAAEFQAAQPDFVLALNVTPDNVTPQTARTAAQLARELEIDPGTVMFEITETAASRHPVLAQRALHDLRTAGFEVYLDDFGTGQSSLMHVHDLPISGLKLDREFTSGSLSRQQSLAITKVVRDLAAELEIGCVAEGVETEAEEAMLLEIGYEHAQGWLYGRAESIDSLLGRIGDGGTGLDRDVRVA